MDVPAYLFQPLKETRREGTRGAGLGARRRACDWSITMWPFVKEAVDRGYVVICPE